MELILECGKSGEQLTIDIDDDETAQSLREKYFTARGLGARPLRTQFLLEDGNPLFEDSAQPLSATPAEDGMRVIVETSAAVLGTLPTCPWVDTCTASPCGRYLVTGSAIKAAPIERIDILTGSRTSLLQRRVAVKDIVVSTSYVCLSHPRSPYVIATNLYGQGETRLCVGAGVHFIVMVKDDHVIACTEQGLCIFDLSTGRCVKRCCCHGYTLAVSNCGQYLACYRGYATVLLDVTTGSRLCSFPDPRAVFFTRPVFSPEATHIATCNRDHSIAVWALPREGDEAIGGVGVPAVVLKGHTTSVSCMCFSPCGQYVFSVSLDFSIRQWGVAQGAGLAECVHCAPCVKQHIYSLACNADGSGLIVGQRTGVRMLAVPDGPDRVPPVSRRDAAPQQDVCTFSELFECTSLGDAFVLLVALFSSVLTALAMFDGEVQTVVCTAQGRRVG